ncbi:MAG: AAA family ATPase [Marinisporobacter sp.]|jgi:DNA helicase-2/ATP-dependent DNA helicase PcrA|nr:AAA family ATPase [Marinisporobacter sp.]
MDSKVNAVECAKLCLDNNESFVLQGGAGSGKTETLKELLEYMSRNKPEKRIVCITHTNLAVDEIINRVGNQYTISTIHSFLHSVIKDYKKNIKMIINELFTLPKMVRESKKEDETENDYKKREHAKYKKIYSKYADKLYQIRNKNCKKVIGKREYDKNPEVYNSQLNEGIEILNKEICVNIDQKDYNDIKYNDTKFNSLKDLTYGHDGLLDITNLLFNKYPLLKKIICDRYDYIFIDEYQDTREDIISNFLSITEENPNFSICLFGDSMQAIYPDGIGKVDNLVYKGAIRYIPKSDNYRCSPQVIDIINTLRFDDIEQEIAFKKIENGNLETLEDRQGSMNIIYAVCDKKPHSRSNFEEKEAYLKDLDKLIGHAQTKVNKSKLLLLTNKAIAEKVGFPTLYKIFDDRYVEIGDKIDENLKYLQIMELCELCYYFSEKQYNKIINKIKRNGFVLNSISDKEELSKNIKGLLSGEYSITEALDMAFEFKLIKKSESYINYLTRKEVFINAIGDDERYQEFKKNYQQGLNTHKRINTVSEIMEEEFKELERKYKKEQFYDYLFSNAIKFNETYAYHYYINEKTDYITMHKTKGSSIDSVIVVMDEYFWNSEYDFSLIYSNHDAELPKKAKSQKLIYVACSRAKTNLVCVRIIKDSEEEDFLKYFPQAEKVDLLAI